MQRRGHGTKRTREGRRRLLASLMISALLGVTLAIAPVSVPGITRVEPAGATDFTQIAEFEGSVGFVSTGASQVVADSPAACANLTSSTNTLSGIPAGATIRGAFLFWAAAERVGALGGAFATVAPVANTIDVDFAGTPLTITGDVRIGAIELGSAQQEYGGYYTDVTAEVAGLADPNGTYTTSIVGGHDLCGEQGGGAEAWQLMVFYDDPSVPVNTRYFVFGGMLSVWNETVTIPISGYEVPAAGGTADLTMFALQGDSSIANENGSTSDPLFPDFPNNFADETVNGGATAANGHAIDIDTYSGPVTPGSTSMDLTLDSFNELFVPTSFVLRIDSLDTNPDAVDDSDTTSIDIPVDIDWDDNDDLADGATLDSFDTASVEGGTVSDNGDGTFNYIPPPGFIGTDTFNYTICDNDTPTATCDTATVTVVITAGTVDPLTCPNPGLIDWSTFSNDANVAEAPINVHTSAGVDATLSIVNNTGGGSNTDFETNRNGTQGGFRGFLQLAMNPTNLTQNDVLQVDFSEPVAGFSFTALDVDIRPPSGNYRDAITVTGSLGGTPVVPTGVVGGAGVAIVSTDPLRAEGQQNISSNNPAANLTVTFPTPVDSVTIVYDNGPLPLGGTNPTNQLIGLSDFSWCGPAVGAAKSVSAPVDNGDGTYTATYTYLIENFGGTPLHDVQLTDDLAARFGTFTAGVPTAIGEYTIGAVTIDANARDPLTSNAGFTGTAPDTGLFDGDTGSLDIAEQLTVSVPVTFFPSLGFGGFAVDNNADVSGDTLLNNDGTPDGDATDTSTNGTDPDPNSDDNPDESDPTPLQILPVADIGVAKEVANIVAAASGNPANLDVTYSLVIRNNGTVPFNGAELTDDLSTELSPAFVGAVGPPTIAASTATLDPDINTAYDGGVSDSALLTSGTGVIEPGQTVTVEVTVEVDATSTTATLFNQATAGGAVCPADQQQADSFTYSDFTYTTAATSGTGTLGANTFTLTRNSGWNFGFPRVINFGSSIPAPHNQTTEQLELRGNPGNMTFDFAAPLTLADRIIILDTDFGNETATLRFLDAAGQPIDPSGFGIEIVGNFGAGTVTVTTNDIQIVAGGGNLPNPIVIITPNLPVTTVDLDAFATASYDIYFAHANCTIDTTDLSDSGSDPTGTNPGEPNDSGGSDDPTPLRFASVALVKSLGANADEDASGTVTTGDTLTYNFEVSNDGGLPLTSVGITDPLPDLSAITCPVTTLAPGETTTCTATYVVTTADAAAGSIDNTATPGGTPPGLPPISGPPSMVSVPVDSNPSVALVKSLAANADEDTSGDVTVGDTLTYEFEVTNDGDVALTAVAVTDPLPGLSAITCPATTLAPSDTTTCSATYVVTTADADAGQIDNTAVAMGTPPGGPSVDSPPSMVMVPVVQNPEITAVKTLEGNADEDSSGDISLGDTISYEIEVTNVGDVTLTNVTVADSIIATVSCPTTTLAPAASTICTGDYSVTQADVDAGEIVNIAVPTGTPPGGPPVDGPPVTVTTPLPQSPSMTIVKSLGGNADEDTSGSVTVGDTLTYEFVVTNTGDVTLTAISVTDDIIATVTCPATDLAPGESTTCSGDYVVIAADADAGEIVNIAVPTGTPPPGGPPLPPVPPSTVTTPVSQNPSMTIVKSLSTNADEDGSTTVTLDDTLSFEFLVTNDGDVTLTAVSVTDTLIPSVSCPTTTLAAGDSTTCTGDYIVTQADVDNGQVLNSAVPTGTPPPGSPPLPPIPPSIVIVPIAQNPSIAVVKSLGANADEDGSTDVSLGDTLTYEFEVTNDGDVNLTGVVVTDPLAGLSAPTCPTTTLAVGASTTCTATYVVTAADADAGQIDNTATATGTPPVGPPVDSPPSPLSIPVVQNPSIALVKQLAVAPSVSPTVGEVLTFEFVVTNDGDVTLDPISVADPLPGLSAIVCPQTVLAAGASTTCTATYSITQADIDAGQIDNTATPTGTPPGGPPFDGPPDNLITPLTQTSSVAFTKTATSVNDVDGSGNNTLDDIVTYTFVATNTGNVSLTAISINDPLPSLSALACDIAAPVTLAPAAALTCTATYTLTQTDIDNGQVDNTATVTGFPPVGPPVNADDTEMVPTDRSPSISLAKVLGAAPTPITVDDIVTYDFTITNTGNTTLTDVILDDPLTAQVAATCGTDTLAPGDSTPCSADYVVTQADIDAAVINNTATTTGTPPGGLPPVNDTSNTSTILPQNPSITIDKSLDSPTPPVAVNDVLTYEFLVTNDGDVTLTDVTITDPLAGLSALACTPIQPTTLLPGEQVVCTATYTFTQADADAGGVTNTATATGLPPLGTPPVTDDDTELVTTTQNPSITLTKSLGTNQDQDGSGDVSVDDVLSYDMVVTNDGDVTLTNVSLTDAKLGLVAVACNTVTTLTPGASTNCSFLYTVTQADIDAGSIDNIASVTGDPPVGPPVTDDDTEQVIPPQSPQIQLDKAQTANADEDGSSDVSTNDTLTYSFTITNTGDVTLTGVAIDDARLGLTGLVCGGVTTLVPGGSTTCTADYTVTQTDVDGGGIVNTATATGTPPIGPPVTDDDTETVVPPRISSMTVTKTLGSNADEDGSTTVTVDDTLTYEFLVTNTGDVTLTAITVTDTLIPAVSCPTTTLAPGDTTTCTGDYTVTQTDVDAGQIVNTATGGGNPPPGGPPLPPVPPSTVTTPVPQAPSMTVLKTLASNADEDGSTTVTVDDTLTYEFLVTNDGDVTLTAVSVTDDLIPAVTCPTTTLAPGDTTTCTGDYTVTQTDVNAGQIVNTATGGGNPPPGGPPLPPVPPSTVTTPVPQAPSMTVLKTLASNADEDGSTTVTVDDTLTYEFFVTNTGNVSLTAIVIDDATIGLSGFACDAGPLAPGAFVSCTSAYTVTQADVDAGQIVNTATGGGNPPPGGPPLPPVPPATVTTPIPQAPSMTVLKTLGSNADEDGSTTVTVDDTLTYEFLVTNTGNVTLTAITVTDTLIPAVSCPTTTLAPGDTTTCTGDLVVTQGRADAGVIVNTATGGGNPPPGGPPLPPVPPSTVTTPIPQNPSMTVVKTLASNADEDGSTTVSLDDTLTYEFEVTNDGTVTLTGITVTDTLIPAVSCPTTTLAPGDTTTCTGDYTVTQADVDAGEIINTATGGGNPPPGAPPLPPVPPSTVTTPVPQTPDLTVVKTLASNADEDGSTTVTVDDTLTYEFLVTNDGDLILDAISVTDDLVPSVTCPVSSLFPLVSTVCVGTYTVTQADVDTGEIENTATATGTPPGLPPITSPPSTVTTPVPQNPSLDIVKSLAANADEDGSGTVTVDDTLTYEFFVTNDGDVTIDAIVVNDDLIASVGCPATALAPVETTTCSADYVVTAADAIAGEVVNNATVVGMPPSGGPPLPPVPPSTVTTVIEGGPAIGVAKAVTSGPTLNAGGTFSLGYTIVVTNAGNGALDSIQVTEDLSSTFAGATGFTVDAVTSAELTVNAAFDGSADTNLLSGVDTLAEGATGTIELAITLNPGADRGPYLNTAVAGGTSPTGDPVTDNSDSGTDPDPDAPNAGEPGDTGGTDDPTPLTLPDPEFDLSVVVESTGVDTGTRTASWRVTVSNSGTELAPGPLTTTIQLPDALTLGDIVVPAGWSCTSAGPAGAANVSNTAATQVNSAAGETITCTSDGDLLPGESAVFELTSTYPAGFSGPLQVDAMATSVLGLAVEADQTNNDDVGAITIAPPSQPLPRTGGEAGRNVSIALALIAIGAALVVLETRRKRRRPAGGA